CRSGTCPARPTAGPTGCATKRSTESRCTKKCRRLGRRKEHRQRRRDGKKAFATRPWPACAPQPQLGLPAVPAPFPRKTSGTSSGASSRSTVFSASHGRAAKSLGTYNTSPNAPCEATRPTSHARSWNASVPTANMADPFHGEEEHDLEIAASGGLLASLHGPN